MCLQHLAIPLCTSLAATCERGLGELVHAEPAFPFLRIFSSSLAFSDLELEHGPIAMFECETSSAERVKAQVVAHV